jgi:hypothetical protein
MLVRRYFYLEDNSLHRSGTSWANTAEGQGAEWFYVSHANDTVGSILIDSLNVAVLTTQSLILCRARHSGRGEAIKVNDIYLEYSKFEQFQHPIVNSKWPVYPSP